MESSLALPWFRMYAEAVDDEKLRLLAFEDRWHFVAILCLKCQGSLDSDAPHLERRIALKLGLQLPQLEELKRRLSDIGLISADWQPVKWDSRQYESDSSAARTRAWRARDKSKRHGDVTVTDKNRTDTEQNRTEQTQKARALGGVSSGTITPIRPTLSPEFEDFLIETYPETSHRRDYVSALHSAMGIVGSGGAAEADLRRRLTGFRQFVDTGGFSGPTHVPSPQSWFRLHQQGEAYWQREWAAKPTKAEQRQDSNIAAGLAFLAQEPSS